MTRLIVCTLFLLGAVASAQTASERREAIRKAREAKVLALEPPVEQRIEAAQRNPRDARSVLEATRTLRDVLRDTADARLREAALLRVATVEALVDQAIAANPNDAPLLLMEKASLLFNAGRKGEVEALVRASMDVRPNLEAALALLGIHDRRGEGDQVISVCQRTRPHLSGEPQVWELLEACIQHSGALTPEKGLAWASAEDRAFYFRFREQQRQARPAKP
jgi:hypothetical protein